jgi:hypothetical protein
MTLRSLVPVALAATLVAACANGGSTGGSDASSAATTAGGSAPSTPASPTASVSETPEATTSPLIEDGRNFAFVKKVDTSSDPMTVTYDLAYFLTGDEAARAAKDHGDESPPPNDYYVVNDNPKLRTVALAPDARLVLLDWTACCDDTFAGSLEDFARAINRGREITVDGAIYKGGMSPYWLVARGGTIVRIEEQYLP